jgi:hypothetical protein
MTQNPASRCARRVVADIVNAGASPTSVARTLKRDPGSGSMLYHVPLLPQWMNVK